MTVQQLSFTKHVLQEEDDQLLETATPAGAPGVVLENLTLAQLGGYEGVVQVSPVALALDS